MSKLYKQTSLTPPSFGSYQRFLIFHPIQNHLQRYKHFLLCCGLLYALMLSLLPSLVHAEGPDAHKTTTLTEGTQHTTTRPTQSQSPPALQRALKRALGASDERKKCPEGKLCIPLHQGGCVCVPLTSSKHTAVPPAKQSWYKEAYDWSAELFRFYFLDAGSGIFWMYILAHFLLGGIYFSFYLSPTRSFSPRKIWSYVFPARIYFSRQFVNDACITLLNQLYPVALFLSLEVYSNTVGAFIRKSMLSTFGSPSFEVTGTTAAIIFTIFVLLASDLSAFLAHTLQHRVPFLWEFHKVHHSAETLTPLTNNRSHPVDLLLIGNMTGLVIGVIVGIAGFLSNNKLDETTITWINILVISGPLILENFQHSHIPISFGPLDHVIMSPILHQIHHSKAPEHLDSNMAQIFSFWDRMTGTLVMPKKGETLVFGLDDEYDDDYGKLWVIYFMPFVRAFQLVVRAFKRTQ
ncbi:MAG: hypothetical protein CL920_18895 [Deltaproteobacteria bacterium]|nr:hypothetical protein [Deltaproteobacteria bacterium]MBU50753.1 hypothetical protein [Deltaproteobacteria bacterium]